MTARISGDDRELDSMFHVMRVHKETPLYNLDVYCGSASLHLGLLCGAGSRHMTVLPQGTWTLPFT